MHWDDEREQGLAPAVARLPRLQREAVIRRYYDGQTVEEIAGQLRVSPEVVRARLDAALVALNNFLASEDPTR